MPRAVVSTGIELEYEVFGQAEAPTLVLVMGFAMQLTAWDPRFCESLAARGFRVVRFDNRDIGKSTKLGYAGFPDFMRAMTGDRSAAPYAVEDMADDLDALVVALGVPAAHLVGLSMGGFIVQETAIRHPGRVLSLASIMSSTGDRRVGQARPEALAVLFAPPPPDRAGAVDHAVSTWRVIASPGFPFDEAKVRQRSGEAWDRDHDPAGIARQAAAIVTQRDRTADLGRLRVPAVVIHGADDPLIGVSGGEATARAIPGARLVVVPGMGHDLPVPVWPTVVDAVVDNARRAEA
ncbi:MAG TPA: alpha/beta hydrolase [Polyangiaceae bacterium]|nr:alpha/beta hydrolase [Polyangiaceae bacterium]